jgi:hypothetical protein
MKIYVERIRQHVLEISNEYQNPTNGEAYFPAEIQCSDLSLSNEVTDQLGIYSAKTIQGWIDKNVIEQR